MRNPRFRLLAPHSPPTCWFSSVPLLEMDDDVDLYIWVPIHYHRLRINYLFGKYESVRGCRWRFGLAFLSCWASGFMVWHFVCNTRSRFLSRVVFLEFVRVFFLGV